MANNPGNKVQVGFVQMTCSDDQAANIVKAADGIRKAAASGARIICLQELFTTRYFCFEENYDHFSLAEPVPGPSVELFSKITAELQVVLILSLFEKRSHGLYHNTVVVLDADGQYLGKYRKQHIPDDPGYYEKFYFTPGDGGYQVFDTRYARIGTLICWDQWYPEAARITALMGAEIIFYPTAIGWALSQPDWLNEQQYQSWQTMQRAHAIANGVFVVAVNRTGNEGEMRFWGGSFIAAPSGEILYQASHTDEVVQNITVDLSAIGHTRVHWPFLRDRRIDTYQPLTNRFIDRP